jgi:phosphoribosylformylglycinamidine synthase
MVGKLPDAARAGRLGFAGQGDAIALVGPFAPSLTGSELAKLRGEVPAGALPAQDAGAIRGAHEQVRLGVRSAALRSAHDIAEGGIAVALAECCIAGGIGASVRLPDSLEPFGESPGTGFIVTGDLRGLEGAVVIGQVGGARLEIEGVLNLAVSELAEAHARGLAEVV